MGRRREPRHPLGLGERDDRDRLKQELKKARKKKRRDSAADADLEDVGSDGGAGDGDDVVVPIDTKAEAGGMGLLLVPLTPAGKPPPARASLPTAQVFLSGFKAITLFRTLADFGRFLGDIYLPEPQIFVASDPSST